MIGHFTTPCPSCHFTTKEHLSLSSLTGWSLLLGEQPSFFGLFLVDVFPERLIGQEVAEDAQGAEDGDVEGDQGGSADREQDGRDDGRKGAAEDAGDLVGERRPRAAHAGAEELRI